MIEHTKAKAKARKIYEKLLFIKMAKGRFSLFIDGTGSVCIHARERKKAELSD